MDFLKILFTGTIFIVFLGNRFNKIYKNQNR